MGRSTDLFCFAGGLPVFLLVALDTWNCLSKFSLSDQILRTLDRPTRMMQLVVCLTVGQEIAMSHILCNGEVVVGEEVLRYCFKALASYQRVSAAADFENAWSASVFLEVVGALRATFRLAHCRLATGKNEGCILEKARMSATELFVDTEYEECEEDAFDALTGRGCPPPSGKSVTHLMEAARTCDMECV